MGEPEIIEHETTIEYRYEVIETDCDDQNNPDTPDYDWVDLEKFTYIRYYDYNSDTWGDWELFENNWTDNWEVNT